MKEKNISCCKNEVLALGFISLLWFRGSHIYRRLSVSERFPFFPLSSLLFVGRYVPVAILHRGPVDPSFPVPSLSTFPSLSVEHQPTLPPPGHISLGPDNLQLLGAIQKVVGVRLGRKVALVRLLHKVLVPLLLGKLNGLLLGAEGQVRALHKVARRLPAHQLVFPAVALFEHVPVHAPEDAAVGGLGGGFGGEEDAGAWLACVVCTYGKRIVVKGGWKDGIPNGAGLQLHGSARDDSGWKNTFLGTILDVFGDWSPGAAFDSHCQLMDPKLHNVFV